MVCIVGSEKKMMGLTIYMLKLQELLIVFGTKQKNSIIMFEFLIRGSRGQSSSSPYLVLRTLRGMKLDTSKTSP